jgi:CO/xanthine dehydrogenase FAD-binding subunit
MPILKDFRFHAPHKLSEALALLDRGKSPMILAGGTFALNTLKKVARAPSDVISLRKIEALCGIKPQKSGLKIGAMTAIADVAASKAVQEAFPSLAQAALSLGTTPVRHMGTIGGNIASRFYWVDLPAVLISLGAEVSVAQKNKTATLSLEEFLLKKPFNKFILTHIFLPESKAISFYFRHTRTVQEVDAPYLALAFSCSTSDARRKNVRCVVNTALSLPLVLKNVESLFENTVPAKITGSEIREALRHDTQACKLDDFRLHLLSVDLERLANEKM